MSIVRARFDGKVFVPEQAVSLPVGEMVEIRFSEAEQLKAGTSSAILQAMKNLPKVSAQDVAEMERLIEEGMSPARFEGAFDSLSNADSKAANGS
jgi:predicted DNA-binding antitoxin AbrB/MazE fold protein